MRRLFLLISIVSILSLAGFALDWPSESGTLEQGFGAGSSGGPQVQLLFTGESTVRAADSGELLFFVDGQRPGNGFPSPLGSWLSVDHGDGLFSVYANLDPLQATSGGTIVEKGSVLGRAGRTGWMDRIGFRFSLFDRKEARWVNPVMVAPPRVDARAPQIRAVQMVNASGQAISIREQRSLRQGTYRLRVEVADAERGASSADLPPLLVTCSLNGMEQKTLHLDTIMARAGTQRLSSAPQLDARSLYASWPLLELGQCRLSRGRSNLEIIVRDANGNSSTASFLLVVE